MMERLRESRWVYILLSILLAFVFWLYVRAEQDPETQEWFTNVPVELTGTSVLTKQGLTISGLSSETVSLYLEAPVSTLSSLRSNRKDMSVVIDVSKCVEGDNTLSYIPRFPENVNVERVVTSDRKPGTITVTVEKLYTSTFAVEFLFQGKVANGYQAGTAAISPETVVVSGPEEQVSQVARVVAILEDNNLDERFAGDLPLTLLDSSGNPLTDLDVTLDASTAYVVLPVVVVKEIPLTVNVIPGGGAEESDATVEIMPKTIFVSGAEEDVQELTELSLGSVDLSQVVGSRVFTFPISLDPSLENVSGLTSASVSVTVNGLATRTIMVENIVPSNVPNGYSAVSVTQAVQVTVRGSEEDLESIDASQLRIVADLSDITTVGTYSVPSSRVKVYLNAGGSVGVIGEYTITVSISR